MSKVGEGLEWLSQTELKLGETYVAHYQGGDNLYLLLAVNRELSRCPYINKSSFSYEGNFTGSFTGKVFREATMIEKLTLRESIKNRYYTPVYIGEYKITGSNGEYYTAASEVDNKVEWTEECKDIVKYIKDGTPIFLFGAVTHKPQTFKELKKLVWQE